jgi:hypothetical protein
MARRVLVLLATLGMLTAGVAVPVPVADAASATTVVRGFALPDTIGAQQVARDVFRVSGPGGRMVALQYRHPDGSWRTVATARTSAERRSVVLVTTTRSGGQWVWRARVGDGPWVVAARTASARLVWRVHVPRTTGWTAASSQERVRAVPAAPRFPLGFAEPVLRSARQILPGLSLSTYRRGVPGDGYVVSLRIAGQEAGSRTAAEGVVRAVRAAGWPARVEKVVVPAVADHPEQVLFMARHGSWGPSRQDRAQRRADRMTKAGLPAWVDVVGEDGHPTSGPYGVTILTLDPAAFPGTCTASVGASSAARETTSAMAGALGAVAGVNGGFFDITGPAAFSGDPLGVSVVGGEIVSEAIDGRTALILDGCRARVAEVRTRVRVHADTASRGVEGVNRRPRADEVVLFTPHFGTATPATGGVDVVLGSDGRVLALREPGSSIPSTGRVLRGVGTGERWLRDHAAVGAVLDVTTVLRDLRAAAAVPLTPTTHVVGGLVGLLRDGSSWINAATNGHASLGMVLRRHPRTLAGTTDDGRLLLVTVDGRRPSTSVGASFVESAALMRWLGATEAVSLDGGGSTTMVVQGKVVNTVAGSAERAVGDGIFVLAP